MQTFQPVISISIPSSLRLQFLEAIIGITSPEKKLDCFFFPISLFLLLSYMRTRRYLDQLIALKYSSPPPSPRHQRHTTFNSLLVLFYKFVCVSRAFLLTKINKRVTSVSHEDEKEREKEKRETPHLILFYCSLFSSSAFPVRSY